MIENLVYTALATLLVIVLLHIGVFWASRIIQPPKPKVVYMQQPQQQQQYATLPPQVAPAPIPLPPPPMAPPMAPQSQAVVPDIKLPTYDTPPVNIAKPILPSLPPPIETRDPARS